MGKLFRKIIGVFATIFGFIGLWATAPNWVAYLVCLLAGLFALTVEIIEGHHDT